MESRLVLASASPRRRELLARLGLALEVSAPEVDETARRHESAEALAARLAETKARAVRADAAILAADTVVAVGERVLGKPGGAGEAARMLALLSGVEHRVVTALALLHEGALGRVTVVTRVRFRRLGDRERSDYAASGEARDAAGAYAVQGGAAAFVTRLVGSYSNVVGLPLAQTASLLRGARLIG